MTSNSDTTTGDRSPVLGIEVITNRFVGTLSTWVTGEADIDILDVQTKKIAFHRWGMRFDDSDYAALFRQLTDALLNLSDSG